MTISDYFEKNKKRFNDKALVSELRRLYYQSKVQDASETIRKSCATQLVWLYNVAIQHRNLTCLSFEFLASSLLADSKELCFDKLIQPSELCLDKESLDAISQDRLDLINSVCVSESTSGTTKTLVNKLSSYFGKSERVDKFRPSPQANIPQPRNPINRFIQLKAAALR